ncbi:hypothetical protein ACM39_13715 [Chryseobacterium sp. FH2]|uniref:hypothetical protein n=1 Tax=Chryseobacterium sp. FH2 TaxID=1674291 RepID=UPI00065AA98A|nr:hypothetical protein [Chryseobacterium sp. FH2]KMQ67488.1 hypothetical protein ACM39_13715 [Chryseobacterium sp. FH2]
MVRFPMLFVITVAFIRCNGTLGKEILTFAKIEDEWKISTITFLVESAHHFKQPSLQERTKK